MSTTSAKFLEDCAKLLVAIMLTVLVILFWDLVELNKSVGWGKSQEDNEKNPVGNYLPQTLEGTTNQVPTFIIPKVKVDRNRSYGEVVKVICRSEIFIDNKAIDNIPKGESEEVDLHFFKLDSWEYSDSGFINNEGLIKALDVRGLKTDVQAVISYNEANPRFADVVPHGISWKDSNGNWYHAAFDRIRKGFGRRVGISSYDYGWRGNWWFVGVPK